MSDKHTGNVQNQVSLEEHETVGGLTGKAAKRTTEVPLTTTIDYDGSNNPIYVGKALLGSAKGDTVWQIQKITFDGSNNPTDVAWAGGSDKFNFEWDERVGYSYS